LETLMPIARCRRRIEACALFLLAVGVVAAAWPARLQAAASRKTEKIKGILTQVEPTRLAIRDNKGNDVAIKPKEDFTEKVAVGTEVTAWYYPGEPVNELQWLEYPPESSFVSPDQFLGQIKKIILLPHSSAGDADGLFDAVEDFLQTRLGWFVAHRMLAEEVQLRSRKAESTLDVIDPATGDVDLTRYATEHHKLIQEIADLARVDAVLEADVEQVQVEFRSQVAAWDGQQQLVSSKTSRTLTLIAAVPIDGHVPAATAVFKLWDPQGRLLWTHRRGFCVLALQQGIGTKFRDRPISEAVQDTERTQKWLDLVFGSWLPGTSSGRGASTQK
jgi:hypothetical protein